MEEASPTRKPIIIPPGQGRSYGMGRIRAVFKADAGETADRYCVSEWWLEPHTRGPGPHRHAEDHVYYVITGTLNVCLDGEWSDAASGSYIVIPGDTPHDFQNRGAVPAGFIAFNAPGGFEADMADIAPYLAAEDLRLTP